MKKNIKRDSNGRFTKNRSEFSFVNLATYTSPEVIEVKNKEWVQYGADNNYFQFLIDRYNGSPTNNACVNGISQAVYGKGLNATDANKKPGQYAEMITLLKPDIVRKISYDLKLMGQAAIQVIYSKDRSKIAQLEHFPIETLRAEKADSEGDVTGYYYFNDWPNIKPSDNPLRIPSFGTSKENIEIMYIKPYKSGFYYYSPVDYQGGLQYCELEEEISNYHLNNILNGLAPSMLINFNNGTPNQEQRELIEARIAAKFSGSSNAGKFILAFNDNKESQAEITPVQLSDAHSQYQFLSTESQSKILVAHRVVSPMLLGIKDNTGLGNNAEEIKTASLLMDNTVIRPFQELLIDSFDKLLAYNNIALNLYFTTLQPLEFTDIDRSLQNDEEIEEETGVKMSSNKEKLKEIDGQPAFKTIKEAENAAIKMNCKGYHVHIENSIKWFMPCESHDKIPETLQKFIDLGEDIDDTKWETIFEHDVDYDSDDKIDAIITELNSKSQEKLSLFSKIYKFVVSTGSAYPNSPSPQDKKVGENFFKVRYYYSPRKVGSNARKFCRAMKQANKLYRKQDIVAMGRQKVNPGWGPEGADNYSIWLYKGGGNCRHSWRRVTYKSKTAKINTKDAQDIIGTRQAAIMGYKVTNPYQVSVQPRNLPNRGFLPGNPQGN